MKDNGIFKCEDVGSGSTGIHMDIGQLILELRFALVNF